MNLQLRGYKRDDGSYGFRNHVIILPSVGCANDVALRLAQQYPQAKLLLHRQGCSQVGADHEQSLRTLAGLGQNPNVAGVLVVGLGCETILPDALAGRIAESGKMVEHIVINEQAGINIALAKGAKALNKMLGDASKMRRSPCAPGHLTIGLKCGLSDTTSGLAANPATGIASDLMVDNGGTVLFSETPELIGAEALIESWKVESDLKKQLLQKIKTTQKRVLAAGGDIQEANVAPGNVAGGISTIEEKSLGAIRKGGSRPLQGILEYAESPKDKGLYFMDGPGRTPEVLTGLLAAGAQAVVFTTGGGSIAGTPIAPVIKVTANEHTAKRLKDHIDVDVSPVINADELLLKAGDRIFRRLVEVANGDHAQSEILGYGSIAIWNISPLCG